MTSLSRGIRHRMVEQKIAGLFRLALLFVVLVVFALLLAPMQRAARRWRPTLARRLPVLFCRSLCWCVNVHPRFHGTPADGPVLLTPNHVSWLDIPALGSVGPVAFIAKREVGQWPVIGSFARLQGAVFVDRSRRRLVRDTNRQIAERMVSGQGVVLFAEGTTGCGSRLKRFYTSHFEAPRDALRLDASLRSVRVQPVSIAYTRRNGLPLSRRHRPAVAWYGDMTLLPHLWGMLTCGPIDCVIHFAEPIAVDLSSNRKDVGRAAECAVRRTTAMVLLGRAEASAPARSPLARPVLIGAETS